MKFSKKVLYEYESEEMFLCNTDDILEHLENAKRGIGIIGIPLPKKRTNKNRNCIRYIAKAFNVKPKDIKKLIRLNKIKVRLNKIKDWLELAMGDNDEARGVDFSTEFKGKGYRFTTDGTRVHIAKSKKPLRVKETTLPTDQWESEILESVIVRPKFLIEALQIFKDDNEIILSISENEDWEGEVDNGKGIKLLVRGTQSNKKMSAWIMGMIGG